MRNKIVTTFFCLLLVGAAALSLALPTAITQRVKSVC